LIHIDANDQPSLLYDATAVYSPGTVPFAQMRGLAFNDGDVVVGYRSPPDFVTGPNPMTPTKCRMGECEFFREQLLTVTASIAKLDQAGGQLVELVNRSTLLPGSTTETFNMFGEFAYDDGVLAFIANSVNEFGLFVLVDGQVHDIVSAGDTFDGKVVRSVDISRTGLSGDTLAFIVNFEDGDTDDETHIQGLYTLSISQNFGSVCNPFDVNCDGNTDGLDIQPFVDQVINGGGAGCSSCAGDADASGVVDAADMPLFVSHLLGT
jgi:hypothetical protein